MALPENEIWYSDIVPIAFNNLKVRVMNMIGSDYPKLKFVSPNEAYTESNFPTVRLWQVDMYEVGNGLDYDAIEAFNVTLQADVISLNAKDTERIRTYVIKAMHDIGFRTISVPPVLRNANKQYGYARFRRLVQETDIFITQ